jgi:hypothetical protein
MADDDDLVDEEMSADGWEPDVIDFESNPRELARRVFWCIYQAEQALSLPGQGSLLERLDRILGAALAGRLDPVLYKVCYALRRVPG